MATALDNRLVPIARAQVEKYGKLVDFLTDTKDYDPVAGAVIPQRYKFKYRTKITPPQPYNSVYVDGDVIRKGDMRAYIAAEGIEFEPEEGIAVTIDGKMWKVESVDRIYTGELLALYGLQLRS